MIEKYKADPFHVHCATESKYLDRLRPNNQSKTKIRITPSKIQQTHPKLFNWNNPLSAQQNILAHQSIYFKLNQRHTLGFSLMTEKKTSALRSNYGIIYEYQNIFNNRFRIAAGIGQVQTLELEYSKKINQQLILSVNNTTNKIYSDVFNTMSFGAKYKNYDLILKNRFNFCQSILFRYRNNLSPYLRFTASTEYNNNVLQKPLSCELSLSYFFKSFKSSAIFNLKSQNVRFEIQKATSFAKLLICNELVEGKSVIYLGLAKRNFNISFPICIIQSLIPAVISSLIYAIGYWFSEKQIEQKPIKKTFLTRKQELKLIGDKANQLYNKQRNINGLLIKEAYYGDAAVIKKLSEQNQPSIFYNQYSQTHPQKVIDVTLSLRFYVHHSKLTLVKEKASIFGFCQLDNLDNKILIIYKHANSEQIIKSIFSGNEQIHL